MKIRASKMMAVIAALCCVFPLFSWSCGGPAPGSVLLAGGEEFLPEREFLARTLAENGFLEPLGFRFDPRSGSPEQNGQPRRGPDTAALIEFHASWGEAGGIPVSRTWIVPREDPLAGRTGTSLAACLAGEEILVSCGEIAPPYVGLAVDGLYVTDEAYPLVRYVSVSVREAPPGGKARRGKARRRLAERIAALETKLAGTPMPLLGSAPGVVWLCAAGDLMLGRGSGEILLREGPAGIFGRTAKYLAEADLCMVNLEGAVSGRGTAITKTYTFRFDPRTAPALKAAGIDAALLANNHAFDFGERAFLDTLDHLANSGVAALGAGRDIDAAAAPSVFHRKGLELRLYGIGSYPRERSGWDGSQAAASKGRPGMFFAAGGEAGRLKAGFAQNENALKVLLFHGGNEWTWKPDRATRRLYTELARSGADLLIGSHPHTAQGFEWVENRPVFWSLGNFVFPGMDGTDGGEEGLLIRLGYRGKTLLYLEPVPVRLAGPRSDTGPGEQLRRFYALSRELAGRRENP